MDKTELLKRLTSIEWDDFEVKEASIGLPKNIWETVSAFANCSVIVIYGTDESFDDI